MKKCYFTVVLLVILAVLCACDSGNTITLGDDAYNMSKKEYKKACHEIEYDDFRHEAKYMEKHKKIKVTGEVTQICSEEDADSNIFSTYRVYITKKQYNSGETYYDDDILVYYMLEDHPKLFEGDIVTLYGEMTNSITYETLLETERTIPAMVAVYVKIR